MVIAVASGKGGTGKTTVATNLAYVAGEVTLVDCDVEEPNVHLFLKGSATAQPREVTVLVPVVDEARCDGCGECAHFCEYKALAVLDKRVLVFNELCHSCGGCMLVCPLWAISEVPRRIGVIEEAHHDKLKLLHGKLDVGEAMAPPLIRALHQRMAEAREVIMDAPPGTACPMVTTLRGADFILLVAEPTPFGLHDLKLAVAVIKQLQRACGVVINRSDGADECVREFCKAVGIPVLATIPDDRRVAEVYSRGGVVVKELPEYRQHYEALWRELRETLTAEGAQ